MDKMRMESPDLTQRNIEAIGTLFPNCITETRGADGAIRRAINFDILRQMLTDEAIAGDEVYELSWVGKKAAMVEASRPVRKTLRPVIGASKNWDSTKNLYIEGDNLDVLKLLQESYLGKVGVIYIDPPYNTGHDFIYRDNFSRTQEEEEIQMGIFDEETGTRFVQNTEGNGRFHSDWCSMMYSRLLIARNLLKEDGLIFMSIDDNEIVNLRRMCDEIFGSAQFIAQITLLCNPKGRSQDKYVANCHEYVLIYSKSLMPSGSVSIPKSKEEISQDYSLFDKDGNPYRELELRNTHRDFGRFNRQNLWYPIYVDAAGRISLDEVAGSEPVYPTWDDGFEGCWTWGKEKARAELHLLVCKKVNGKSKIYRKAYAFAEGEAPLKQVKSIWNEKAFFTEKGQIVFNGLFSTKEKLFQSPKSIDMIAQCILMCQSKEALVLDFFSGSGSTAHAVMKLNAMDGGQRKYIMVQLPESCAEDSEAKKAGYSTICELAEERIRRAGEQVLQENGILAQGLDIGFRVLRLDDTNMKNVFYAAGDYNQTLLSGMESNIKEDRTDLDLLFGCLLDWALQLNLPYSSEQLSECTLHTYNDGDLIACFDDNVPEAVVREIASRHPLRVVFRDSSFASSPERINVEEIFKLLSPNTSVKVL